MKQVKQFRETGCVKVKRHIRQSSVVTPEEVDEVQVRMETSPKRSLRRLSQQAHCSYSSARKAAIISDTISIVPQETRHTVLESMLRRMNLRLQFGGGYFQHFI